MDKNRQQFDQEIEKLLSRDQIKREEPLSRHTTFRVGGAAEYYVTPTIAQLPDVVALCRQCELPLTVIGNGSNLLVSDAGLRGVVLELGKAASVGKGGDVAFRDSQLCGKTWTCRHGVCSRDTRFAGWSGRDERGCLWRRDEGYFIRGTGFDKNR